MNNTDQIRVFATMFLYSLPTFVVCVVAGLVILSRWQEGSTGSVWAISGFGLATALCLIMPLGQAMVQNWMFQNGTSPGRLWAMSVLGVANSILHAVIYALLLVAIFAGRQKSGAPTRHPFDPPTPR